MKITISLILAFVGFSCAVIAMLYFVFLRIMAIKAEDGTLAAGITFGDRLLSAAGLALIYGVLVSIALAVPFFLLGFLTGLIGWKLKILRWWTCLILGGLLCMIPMAVITYPMALGTFISAGIKGGPLFSSDLIDIVGMFLASGFCGSIAGLCFWLALLILRFSEITGPIAYPIQFSK
jgi:hypothetical protein